MSAVIVTCGVVETRTYEIEVGSVLNRCNSSGFMQQCL